MSRNNSRRQREKTQNQPKQPQPNIPQQAAVNNPFATAFVVPTEIVDLPTRGMFYSEENPLSRLDSVEIKQMTAREEDILGNQDFISRGIVLDKLIESILIDKNIKVVDLADIDKIAILATARKSGFGDEYKHMMTCEECNKESVFIFSMKNLINNATETEENNEEDFFTESNQDGAFDVELAVCGYTATFRPLNSADYEYLEELEKQRSKHSLDFNHTVEFLRRMIISVHKTENLMEITSDPSTISQFLDFIPAQDSRRLKLAHGQISPTFRMHEEVECPACSAATDKEVPFSWAMFWGNT